MLRRFHFLLAPLICLATLPGAYGDDFALQSGSFDSKGVKIAYVTAGKGEPVILVHGLYSSAEMNWQLPGTFKLLAQHYHVVALDLRGHGKSDKPTEESDYGQPMVDDITRLMDHLEMKKAHIIGYSLGGIIVMKLVIDHPDRIQSAALGGMGWLREGGALQGVWEKMGGSDHGSTPPACVHGIAKLAVTADAVKAINLPVEVLVGDRDPCKRLYVEPLEIIRKDWPVIEIKDAGHLNCIAKDQFKQELEKWLDRNAAK